MHRLRQQNKFCIAKDYLMQNNEPMKLPPLNSIRAYEAAARTGSFTAAASELGVTSAAVSMQVRNLENFLGKKLFVRSNNRITITDAGMAVYHGSATALSGIAAITERLLESEKPANLVISVVASLAERWLTPQLAEFSRIKPGIGVEIRVENQPVDIVQNRIDLRLTYGRHHYPDFRAVKLFTDEVSPMYAPGFSFACASVEDLSQIPDARLIHVDWGENFVSQPSWSDWFGQVGIKRNPEIRKGIKVATSSLAIAMAEKGLGVALGQKALAWAELGSGALVAPFRQTLTLAQPYYAIATYASSTDTNLNKLLSCMTDAC
jgi:LysR family glycine cleavage system transcriptional activator